MSFMLLQTPDPRTLKVRAAALLALHTHVCRLPGLGCPPQLLQDDAHLPAHYRLPVPFYPRIRLTLVPSRRQRRRRRSLPLRLAAARQCPRRPPRHTKVIRPPQPPAEVYTA